MKEETLHPWIEPEVEARITALVLGEASDFEREELERLIGEQAELAMFRKRMETVHGLLREVATGEAAADDDGWKLSDERRAAVLAVIDGEGEERVEVKELAKKPVSQPKSRRGSIFKIITQIAAVLFVMAIIAGLMMPAAYKGVLEKAQAPAYQGASSTDAEAGDSASRTYEVASSDSAPVADSAQVGKPNTATIGATMGIDLDITDSAQEITKPDPAADSRSSLAAIQGNLDAYSRSSEAPANSVGSGSAGVVAGDRIEMPTIEPDLHADVGGGRVISGGGVTRVAEGQLIDGTGKLKNRSDSFAYRPDRGSSSTESFAGKTDQPAKRRKRMAGELAQTDMALEKSVTSPPSEPTLPAVTMDDDARGLPVSSLVSANGSFADKQNNRKMDRDAEGRGMVVGEDKGKIPATRQLAETQSPMLRGQIAAADAPEKLPDGYVAKNVPLNIPTVNQTSAGTSTSESVRYRIDIDDHVDNPAETQSPMARGKIAAAEAPEKPMEAVTAGRGGGEGKKEQAKAPGQLAPAAPAAARPAPAAASKLAKEEALREENMDPPAEREADEEMKSYYARVEGEADGGMKTNYSASAARNDTSAKFLQQVAAGWELPVPSSIREGVDLKPATQEERGNVIAENRKAMPNLNSLASEAAWGLINKNHEAFPPAQHEWQRYPGTAAAAPKDKQGPDPSDLWFRAFVLMKEGQDLEKGQEGPAAYHKFVESKRLFDTVASEHPDFHPEIVRLRREELGAKIQQSATTIESAQKDSKPVIEKSEKEGFSIRGAKLNDVFTFLAKRGGLNYFHNPALEGSEYVVTGHLQEGGDPLNQMEELGLMYGVTFLQDGKTVQSLKAVEKKSAAPSGIDEKKAAEEAFSTFSLHVSDVSFKLAQAALAKGEWPDASEVRIEEFVNAFDYGDPMPDQNEKVACRMEQAIHPFLQQRNLLRVSMRTAAAGRSGDTPLRLTFLLDNSGSMERIDRRETVRRAFALLAQQLKPIDQVTLISFARQPRLLADKVSGAHPDRLVQLVSNIPSEGGTNLEAALRLAFEKAREQQNATAQNRVIMLTDGAANLGDADPDSLARMIETMRDAGIAFDAAGIGAEGLNDEILEALTRKGDGRYYLLDQPEDADEGFARQIAGALRPAAKNVKVQVEFNPDRVGNYKLLGFEKHLLKKEDFRNDKVDAAEMAAAEAGMAVYQFEAKPDGTGDVGSVSVRFLDMSSGQMVEKRWPIPYEADAPRLDQAAPSLRIAATAALLAAKLKGEALGQSVDLKTLSNSTAGLPDRYRNAQRVQQLQEMINQARAASR